jgi:hypothetical protein
LGGSDHRPISAAFSLDVTRVLMEKLTSVAEQVSDHYDAYSSSNNDINKNNNNNNKKNKKKTSGKLTWVAEQVSKHLDEVDNTCTPCAEVDASSLTFEHVRYRCVQVSCIHIYI